MSLRVSPIEAAQARNPRPLKRAVPKTEHHDGPLQTLTAFDWLDTVVDEMLTAGDKVIEQRSSRATPASSTFAGSSHQRSAYLATTVRIAASCGQVVLGYSPMIDRDRAVIATRLTVVPMRAGATLDAGALLRTLGEVWPAGGGAVSLNVSSETLLSDLLRAKPATNLMIEVPAFLAGRSEQCRGAA